MNSRYPVKLHCSKHHDINMVRNINWPVQAFKLVSELQNFFFTSMSLTLGQNKLPCLSSVASLIFAGKVRAYQRSNLSLCLVVLLTGVRLALKKLSADKRSSLFLLVEEKKRFKSLSVMIQLQYFNFFFKRVRVRERSRTTICGIIYSSA